MAIATLTIDLGAKLASLERDMGKAASMHAHPACDHAFCKASRPEVYVDAASAVAFKRTVALFRASL